VWLRAWCAVKRGEGRASRAQRRSKTWHLRRSCTSSCNKSAARPNGRRQVPARGTRDQRARHAVARRRLGPLGGCVADRWYEHRTQPGCIPEAHLRVRCWRCWRSVRARAGKGRPSHLCYSHMITRCKQIARPATRVVRRARNIHALTQQRRFPAGACSLAVVPAR
jgi:hypothetical protein